MEITIASALLAILIGLVVSAVLFLFGKDKKLSWLVIFLCVSIPSFFILLCGITLFLMVYIVGTTPGLEGF